MTRLKCCACHVKSRWWSPKCCACHEKCNASSDFPHVTKHVWMSRRSATPATRNKATWLLKPPKVTPFAELTIGTAIRALTRTVADGCRRLRTDANGCGRKRKVEQTYPQPPDPQSETGTLATHSGKIFYASWLEFPLQKQWTWVLCKKYFSMVFTVPLGPCVLAFCSDPRSHMFLDSNMGWS